MRTHIIESEAQARAISSPVRLEILGHFTDGNPLSVKDIAGRMGRPPSAVHYHVQILEESGLLTNCGERKQGRRIEALYEPIADVIGLPGEPGKVYSKNNELALKTMSAAFRMAERDMRAALEKEGGRSTGEHRNMLGTRLHCRLGREELAQLNRHLDAIQETLASALRRKEPQADDEFLSLTIALLPLPDRDAAT